VAPPRTLTTLDGAFGYVTPTGWNKVAVVEMASLENEMSLPAGKEPMGMIVQ
jgi:hypothetical protein